MLIDASSTSGYIQTFEVSETSKVLRRVFVNANHLPPRAQILWHEFWEAFDPAGHLPRGVPPNSKGNFFK